MSAQLTGASIEVSYKETRYVFHALRDCDFAEFEIWAQDRYLTVTKRNIVDLPPEQQTLLLMNAFERASLMTFSSKESAELMKSIEGTSRLLWLSLRKVLTLDETRVLATDKNFTLAAFEKIQLLSGFNGGKKVSGAKKKFHLPDEKKSIATSQKHTDGLHNK